VGAAAVFLALFVHSLFYSGFFEDPIVWGVMAFAAWAWVALPRQAPTGPSSSIGPAAKITEHAQDGGPRRTPAELQHQAPLAD
jgi:hypothetical protein